MSDKTLDQLINTIKSEAIEAAEAKANTIIENAHKEAKAIIHNAEAKKASLIKDGEEEADATLVKGEKALQQAARDLSITLQNDIKSLLDAVLKKEVANAFSPELVKTAVLKVIEQIGSHAEVQLPESMLQDVANYIQKQLKNAKELPTIKGDSNLVDGFSISKTDEGWSYEITPQEIADVLSKHLSANWVKLIKNKE